MLVGHHAVAYAAKRIVPGVPLGILLAASLFADLLVSVDQLVGIEHARSTPGITAFSSLDAYDIAISHSLATSLLWSLIVSGTYFWWRRDQRGATVLGLAVFSHWVLDFVSHRPQLPLAPGVHAYLGLGLWNSIPMTFAIEGALWVGSLVIYIRATGPRSRSGTVGLLPLIAIPTAGWIRTPFMSSGPGDISAGTLIALLALQSGLCVLASWVDRHRSPRSLESAGPSPARTRSSRLR
jgi:membrane-bound metal-dependent hydrolase YbcI (DUF457 family)